MDKKLIKSRTPILGKEAHCEGVDPSEVLRDLDGISKLTLLHCAGELILI